MRAKRLILSHFCAFCCSVFVGAVMCADSDSWTAPLFLDVAGVALTPADERRLRQPLVGGVILFARNWESRAQLGELCAEIRRLRGDVLIAVDQEGGRVQRLRGDGLTRLPPQRVLGRLWEREGAAAACAVAAGSGWAIDGLSASASATPSTAATSEVSAYHMSTVPPTLPDCLNGRLAAPITSEKKMIG